MMRSGLQVEVDLAGHPFLVALGQERGDEAKTRCSVGEDRGDAGPTLDLAIDAFEANGGSKSSALAMRRVENREAVGQIFFSPLREFWCVD